MEKVYFCIANKMKAEVAILILSKTEFKAKGIQSKNVTTMNFMCQITYQYLQSRNCQKLIGKQVNLIMFQGL